MSTDTPDPRAGGKPDREGVTMYGTSRDGSTFNQVAGDQYNIYEPPAPPPAVACTLPAETAAFTGRRREVDEICAAVTRAAEEGRVVAIHAIDGMPGVGKTALAVRVGHLLADKFPDRQLFVDLHAHTPGQLPTDPADALAVLLSADGVDVRYLPGDLDGRAAMWRDRLSGKRALLILDNAATSQQVEPLLPGSAGTAVLITSRRFLADLRWMVASMPLDVLLPDDATEMFRHLAPRARDDPEGAAEVAALCGYLPLAISLLARLYIKHASWTIDDLIRATKARLLTASAENRSIAAAFSLSYDHLTASQQGYFRLLGLHPGVDIEPFAASALTSTPLHEADQILDQLHSDRLLSEPTYHRYRMHDLIREYARSLAADDQTPESEEDAIGRLLDYYQYTAQRADSHLDSSIRSTTGMSVSAPAAYPEISSRNEAQAWINSERANLVSAVNYAVTHHQHVRVIGLAAALAANLRTDGPWTQAVTLHTAAVTAAQSLGDRSSEANALHQLGFARYLIDDYPGASDALEQALAIYRNLGDHRLEAYVLKDLGAVRQLCNDYADAGILVRQAREIFHHVGDRLGEALALNRLGVVEYLQGDYQTATAALQRALVLSRDVGNKPAEAHALNVLGALQRLTGNYGDASITLELALDICRDLHDKLGEADALRDLGSLRRLIGDYRGASYALDASLDIARDLGDKLGEADTQTQLGEIQIVTGSYADATANLEQALETFRGLQIRTSIAESLDLLAAARQMNGEYLEATALLKEALVIYQETGMRGPDARALCTLGEVRYKTGDHTAASVALEQAMNICRDLGDRHGEAEVLNHTGALHLRLGEPQLALIQYQKALELARAIQSPLQEARALEGIGRCAPSDSAEDVDQASLRKALEIYQRIGAAEATPLASEVDRLGGTRLVSEEPS